MNRAPIEPASEVAVEKRTSELFESSLNRVHQRTDRLFANLMLVQWLAGIAAALWISPRTWIGASSYIHVHVWAAIFLGGVIASLPVYLVWTRPGGALNRHVIAVAQMLTSALLIHLSGGRIETHFHVFGSLAFLAFYRDRRVLMTATMVVAVDHFVRGMYWPQSVFGVLTTSQWRWLEHAAWVLFEDTFLFISIRQGLQDMLEVASHRAGLEALNAGVERQVKERTAELAEAHKELKQSENRLRMILEAEPECVKQVAPDGTLLEMNPAGLRQVEADRPEQVVGRSVYDLIAPEYHAMFRELNEATFRGESRTAEFEIIGIKGTRRWMQTHACPLRDPDGGIIAHLAVTSDVTGRKRAEEEKNELNKQLVEISRRAGMAEVATGVLHNVGNVLNSVNVSVTLIGERLRKSKTAGLAKVTALLKEQSADLPGFFSRDARAAQLPEYLEQFAGYLAGERKAVLGEVDYLQKNIGHIKDIVAMQQNYAMVSGVTESIKPAELMEDALRLNANSLERHAIEVVKEFDEVPPMEMDKHKVLQILVNLLRNAKHACEDSGRGDKRMTLRLRRINGHVQFSVRDNGVGIPPENLNRIFNHGFTTRKNGHGFGLHSSANAAGEMGGTITVHSDGPGCGAAFTLNLPGAHDYPANQNSVPARRRPPSPQLVV